jgi:hypothetical protein
VTCATVRASRSRAADQAPAVMRRDQAPAVTAFNASSDSRMSCGKSCSSASPTQRSKAILKTAIPASAVGLAPGRVATELDGHVLDPAAAAQGGPQTRHATAEFVLSLASRGVRSSIVRLAPTNHGDGDNGFMATIVGIARDKGVSAYIGDGSNRLIADLDQGHYSG